MITIFCDFRQFSAKIGIFLKKQCYDPIFALFCFLLSKKQQIFSPIFLAKIFKITTAVPGHPDEFT
jgi:hypothetical protein